MSAQYTLAPSLVTSFPIVENFFFGGPEWPEVRAALPPAAVAGDPDLGEAVVTHRTSWVRRLATPRGTFYIKTYQYGSYAESLRQLLRRPASVLRGRAAREFAALRWLRSNGFEAPEPIAHGARRRFGLLASGVLISREWPGQRLDEVVLDLADAEYAALSGAVAGFVDRLHRAGFRDRNLDPRNVLVRRDGAGWRIAKLDAPRFALRAPGAPRDGDAEADWQRLLGGLPQPFAACLREARGGPLG